MDGDICLMEEVEVSLDEDKIGQLTDMVLEVIIAGELELLKNTRLNLKIILTVT